MCSMVMTSSHVGQVGRRRGLDIRCPCGRHFSGDKGLRAVRGSGSVCFCYCPGVVSSCFSARLFIILCLRLLGYYCNVFGKCVTFIILLEILIVSMCLFNCISYTWFCPKNKIVCPVFTWKDAIQDRILGRMGSSRSIQQTKRRYAT